MGILHKQTKSISLNRRASTIFQAEHRSDRLIQVPTPKLVYDRIKCY